MEDPSFQKWATGRASPEVDRQWQAWVDGERASWPDAHRDTPPGYSSREAPPDPSMRSNAASEASEIIQSLPFQDPPVPPPDVDAAWNRFQSRRQEMDASSDRGIDAGSRRPPRRPRRRQRFRTASYTGAIAVVVLAAVGALLWFTTQPDAQPIAVSTQTGEQITVTLPDDTRIVLNANSRLRYDPNAFTSGPRIVSVDGEALFDVDPAPERDDPTFRVQTPDGTVRVLGTTFSVAHRGDDTRVVLSEGRVAIDSRVAQRDTTFELEPGDLVSFDRQTGQVKRQTVNPKVYTSWASGQLVFDNTPLPDVVARIESTYGVDVVVQDPNVLDRVVSGSVENDLSVLIQGLSQILDRPIEHNGNRIVIR